uniref:Uncharacterized protein n=1 Tax=Opuntia streptacantha TaxID=393608 RepID=A0A7C9E4D1_OPUST
MWMIFCSQDQIVKRFSMLSIVFIRNLVLKTLVIYTIFLVCRCRLLLKASCYLSTSLPRICLEIVAFQSRNQSAHLFLFIANFYLMKVLSLMIPHIMEPWWAS